MRTLFLPNVPGFIPYWKPAGVEITLRAIRKQESALSFQPPAGLEIKDLTKKEKKGKWMRVTSCHANSGTQLTEFTRKPGMRSTKVAKVTCATT
jgi:hypothetical protein